MRTSTIFLLFSKSVVNLSGNRSTNSRASLLICSGLTFPKSVFLHILNWLTELSLHIISQIKWESSCFHTLLIEGWIFRQPFLGGSNILSSNPSRPNHCTSPRTKASDIEERYNAPFAYLFPCGIFSACFISLSYDLILLSG